MKTIINAALLTDKVIDLIDMVQRVLQSELYRIHIAPTIA